jgi:hypothetical protein
MVKRTAQRRTGQCQCGGVAFSVDSEMRPVLNCHCYRCRRFTGHHMAATAAILEQITYTSDDTLRWYSPEPSVAYGFCATCGSSLFWRTTALPNELSICAGVLDLPTGLTTTGAWWMSEHADYHTPEPGVVEHPYDG